MKELLTQLFSEFGFHTEEGQSDTLFFQKQENEKVEYYLVLFLSKTALETYTLETLNTIQQLFNAKKQDAGDIEKNTSLILCIAFDTYAADCPRYKNLMLQIEEDEYWFKKYLLPYTTNALATFQLTGNITQQLNTIVSNEDSFQQFNEQIYKNESYFLSIQCFLKLPFLNLTIATNEQFVSIMQLLSARISSDELLFLNETLVNYQLEGLQWDQLLTGVVNPESDIFDKFLNTFAKDAPTS